MYKIDVLDSGKYNNVICGARYCLFKKTAVDLLSTFLELECKCEIKKFIHITKDIYCWTADNKVVREIRNKAIIKSEHTEND